jgi:glycerol kinase
MIFDHSGREVGRSQREHQQLMPRSGWVEHDPGEIWQCTSEVIADALVAAELTATDLVGLGITNQRETTVVWDVRNGEPYANAIVWQDTRTDRIAAELERAGHGELIRERAGIPPSTYFAGGKLAWLLRNIDGVREAAEAGHARFGTVDSWLLWQLTGGTTAVGT